MNNDQIKRRIALEEFKRRKSQLKTSTTTSSTSNSTLTSTIPTINYKTINTASMSKKDSTLIPRIELTRKQSVTLATRVSLLPPSKPRINHSTSIAKPSNTQSDTLSNVDHSSAHLIQNKTSLLSTTSTASTTSTTSTASRSSLTSTTSLTPSLSPPQSKSRLQSMIPLPSPNQSNHTVNPLFSNQSNHTSNPLSSNQSNHTANPLFSTQSNHTANPLFSPNQINAQVIDYYDSRMDVRSDHSMNSHTKPSGSRFQGSPRKYRSPPPPSHNSSSEDDEGEESRTDSTDGIRNENGNINEYDDDDDEDDVAYLNKMYGMTGDVTPRPSNTRKQTNILQVTKNSTRKNEEEEEGNEMEEKEEAVLRDMMLRLHIQKKLDSMNDDESNVVHQAPNQQTNEIQDKENKSNNLFTSSIKRIEIKDKYGSLITSSTKEPEKERGSCVILTPVKANKKEFHMYGVESVVTPLRKSLRVLESRSNSSTVKLDSRKEVEELMRAHGHVFVANQVCLSLHLEF